MTNDSLPALLTVKQQETGIISLLMNNLLHTAIPYWVKRHAKFHRQHLFQIEENGSQVASIGSSQQKRVPIPAITSKIFSCKKNVYFAIDEQFYSVRQSSAPDSIRMEHATMFKQPRGQLQRLYGSESREKNQKCKKTNSS